IFTGAVHALAVGPFDSRFFDSALPLFYGMAGLVGLIAAAARLVFSGELLDRRPLTRKLPILAGLLAGCLVAAIPVAQDLWNGVKAGTWSYAVPLCVGLFLLLSLQGPRE
ncbi:MAG: hypothetical protein JNK75_02495, partial [Betaproteobacteria bacterium]|nr:hypothetical protein [Betaproteobacteria bacterium]